MGSFDRKVERNQVRLKKKGIDVTTNRGSGGGGGTTIGSRGEGEVFKGRKIVLPITLSLIAILYGGLGIATKATGADTAIFWITIGLYLLLSLVIFLRKPYLRIHKGWLYTSRFNRDLMVDAANIDKIIIRKDQIVIVPKGRGSKWTFNRIRNRFDVAAMAISLEKFGFTHQVKVIKE
jgi:uncharacterized membrane protein YtjA (UPF0391 family)